MLVGRQIASSAVRALGQRPCGMEQEPTVGQDMEVSFQLCFRINQKVAPNVTLIPNAHFLHQELVEIVECGKTSTCCKLLHVKTSRRSKISKCGNLQWFRFGRCKARERCNLQRLQDSKSSRRCNVHSLKRSKTSKCCNLQHLRHSKTSR